MGYGFILFDANKIDVFYLNGLWIYTLWCQQNANFLPWQLPMLLQQI
jgi:hypothetical protein